MSFLLFFIHLLFIGILLEKISFFKTANLPRGEIFFFFFLKVSFGFLLISVYAHFYPQRNLADVFKYFDDASIIWSNAHELDVSALSFLTGIGFDRQNEASLKLLTYTHHVDKQGGGWLEANHLLIIRLNLFLRYFSMGNIYIHSLWFSFISFVGGVGFYRTFLSSFLGKKIALKICIFLIPSVLFWSSGLLKESLVMGCLGLMTFLLYKIFILQSVNQSIEQSNNRTIEQLNDQSVEQMISQIIAFYLLLFFLWSLKPFIVVSFGIALWVWIAFYFQKKWLLILPFLVVIFFANDIANKLTEKRNEYTHLSLNKNAGSIIDTNIYEPNGVRGLSPILLSSLKNCFLEPSFFSLKSKKDIPFAVENMFILLLFFIHLFFLPKLKSEHLPLYFALLTFGLVQCLVIFLSVPVLGALVRYKVTAIPFLLLAFTIPINLIKNKCDYFFI